MPRGGAEIQAQGWRGTAWCLGVHTCWVGSVIPIATCLALASGGEQRTHAKCKRNQIVTTLSFVWLGNFYEHKHAVIALILEENLVCLPLTS